MADKEKAPKKKAPTKAAAKEKAGGAKAKKAAPNVAVKQQIISNDPALAKYNALMVQSEDKKALESSLLTSLIFFFVMMFVVFPEFASRIIGAADQEDFIDIPKQTIVKQEQKQEQKQEVRQRREERQNEFSSIPDITTPTGDMEIVEDIKEDKFEVETESFDDFGFGDMPNEAPGPIEVAGDVIAPVFQPKGAQPFPQKARIMRKTGTVSARLIVRVDGSWEVVEVLQENPPDFGFKEAYLQYLTQSSIKPAMRNGRPVEVYWKCTIQFRF